MGHKEAIAAGGTVLALVGVLWMARRIPSDATAEAPGSSSSASTRAPDAATTLEWAGAPSIRDDAVQGAEPVVSGARATREGLATEPLVASGIVVDDQGRPIAGALVLAELLDARDPAETEPAPARSSRLSNDTTGPNGAFSLRDVDRCARAVLTVSRSGYLTHAPVECASGAADLRIVLPRAATVAGHVFVSEGVDPRRITLYLEPPDANRAAAGSTWSRVTRPQEDGSYRFESIPPGYWTLAVFLQPHSGPLLRIESIPVREGDDELDPRLATIDLRASVRSVSIEVVDARGALVPKARVHVVHPRARDSVEFHADSGRLTLPLPYDDTELGVGADGHRLVRLARIEREVRVALEPSIQVRLRLPREVRIPEKPLGLRAALWPSWLDARGTIERDPRDPWVHVADAECWSSRRPDSRADPRGEIVLGVPEPGRYRIDWEFGLLDSGAEGQRVGLSPSAEVDVVDSRVEQSFGAGFDKSAYAAAYGAWMQKLERR